MGGLRQQFHDAFASTAFRQVAGDDAIVGKFGSIAQLDDGTFDCWFVRPDGSPLSERKLAAIAKKLPVEAGLTKLSGEAYTQGADRAFVLEIASLLGIKRRKRMNDEAKAQAIKRLRSQRQSASSIR